VSIKQSLDASKKSLIVAARFAEEVRPLIGRDLLDGLKKDGLGVPNVLAHDFPPGPH